MKKHYLLAYLNQYFLYSSVYIGKYENYKKRKAHNVLDYLHISKNSQSKFVTVLLFFVSKMELLISLIIVTYYLCLSIILCLLYRKSNVDGRVLVLGTGLHNFNELLSHTKYLPEQIVIVDQPFHKTNVYSSFKHLKIWGWMNIFTLVCCYIKSFQLICFQYFKYKKRDVFFRSYSSFEYFLCYHFFSALDESSIVLFTSTFDRWAYLFGHIKCTKVFVQHGMLEDGHAYIFSQKVGRVDFAYYLSEKQRVICQKYLFENAADYSIMKSTRDFNAYNKLVKNGKKQVLIICNHLFYDEEKNIINYLCALNRYNLYVKPHPMDDASPYDQLKSRYGFSILDRRDFIEVDCVISYKSTLAMEYEEKNTNVIYYGSFQSMEDLTELIDKGIEE